VTSFPTAGGKPYPINLPTAMKLGNARNLDIELASRRLQVAAAQLQGAKVLWLTNLIFGTDYYRHDGQLQDIVSLTGKLLREEQCREKGGIVGRHRLI
jgi:hypothetical protein